MRRTGIDERGRRQGRVLAALTALLLAVGWLLVGTPAAMADGPTTFSNATSIAIPATGSPDQIGPASPYPSSLSVSGMAGAVSNVKVVFRGVTHGQLQDIDAMVVAPSGANLVVLSDASAADTFTFANNATLTFDDAAAGSVPSSGNVATGTYKPTNTGNGGPDSFPAPAPSPSSQTTLAGAFTGINPNGTWQLYAVDDATGDTGTMSGGWSLIITTEVAAVATTTTVTTSGTPSTTGNPVIFTATVRAGGSAVTTGTVQFSDGITVLGSRTLNTSGVATLTTSDLTEGTHQIVATYSGAQGYLTSNGNVTQRVDNATVVTGNTFCNTGPLTIPQQGASVPYPSNIKVSGLAGEITKVTATLKGLSHGAPIDLDVMLAGPTVTQNLMLLSDTGGNTAVNNLTVTFDDAAATAVPSPITSGMFRPTDIDTDAGSPSPDAAFPAPAPATSAATALSTFNGSSANGTWSLWVVDDASGDSGSISGGWCLTITSLVATQTNLTAAPPSPSTVGAPVTFTATVTGGGSPVTDGTVQFSDGGSALGGQVEVDDNGKATFTTSELTVGPHAIQARYTGATGFGDSNDSLDYVVNKAATTTTLTSAPRPSSVGQSVTFTATVAGGTAVPTGTVTFTVDGATGPTVTLDGAGIATFETSLLTAGNHTIGAAYNGDANHAVSSGSLQQVVNKLTTTTQLVSDAPASSFGQPVTFTATVTSGGNLVITGGVEFSDGATSLGVVSLSPAGMAAFTTDSLSVGPHTITATYSGTDTYAGSDDSVEQSVGQAASSTVVTSDPNTSTFGQSVTFTATVTAGGTPLTSGTVRFSEGGTALGGAVTPAANGTATFTTSGLSAGTHTITATYSGTDSFTGSSGSVDQVVNKAPTSTVITGDPNPSTFGQPVTFTATVTGGTPLNPASVEFTDGATSLGTAPVASDGTATLTTSALAVGTHTITATYSGTDDFAGSSGDVVQVVDQAATSTTVVSNLPTSNVGDPVTFTASVTSGGAPVTEGSVTFTVDGNLAQAIIMDLDGAGQATFTTRTLTAGTHTILAEYTGTASFDISDDSVVQTVNLVADAGGPYTIAEGDSLTLDGSGSSPGATYVWDVDGDGVFGDVGGASPTLTWADLEALGIDDGPSSHQIGVRVIAGAVQLDSAAATLTVNNTAPAAVITGGLTATVGVPFTVKVGAQDPSSVDMAAQFSYEIDWGDGSPVETVAGPADPPVTHTYSTAGTVDASFTATDKDGGQGDPTVVQVQVAPAQESPSPSPSPSEPTSTGEPTSPTQPTSTGEPTSTTTSPNGFLASTGASIGIGPIIVGAALLLAGGGLLLMARRRRSTHGSHE